VPDRIVTGDQVKRGKPDPEPYRRGAELLGVQPHDCLVFEDAPSGVRAGVAAGCRVLGVLGTHSAEELSEAGANWIVSSLGNVRTQTNDGRIAITIDAV
jgi:sugar-phosphatase